MLQRRGSVYTTHMRKEMKSVLEAVEAIDVGRRSGVPVQLSHIKVAGRERWGTADTIIELMDAAAGEGVDVRGDVYPTPWEAHVPPVGQGRWRPRHATAARGRSDTPGSGQAVRQRVACWQNFVAAAGWNGVVVAAAPGRPDIEGRSIAALATASGEPPAEAAAQLLLELRGEVVVVLHMMAENDVLTLLPTATC